MTNIFALNKINVNVVVDDNIDDEISDDVLGDGDDHNDNIENDDDDACEI